jgi:uncharacterized protein (TIGR02265 family)
MLALLLVRRLRAQGDFAEALRSVGFDPSNTRREYPEAVAVAALDVACRHVLPELRRNHAHREMGRQFAEEFLLTVVGRVIAAGLPLIGPNRAISRIPRYASLGRRDLIAEALIQGERHWQVRFADVSPELAEFTAGWIDGGLRQTGIAPKLEVLAVGGDEFTIDIRW